MSAAANENGGSRRSVAEVVAEWRSKRARGEPVDPEALFAEIEQASNLLPTLAGGQAQDGQAETPTVSMQRAPADLPSPPAAAMEKPSSRMRAAAAGAARYAGGLDDYEVLREIAKG